MWSEKNGKTFRSSEQLGFNFPEVWLFFIEKYFARQRRKNGIIIDKKALFGFRLEIRLILIRNEFVQAKLQFDELFEDDIWGKRSKAQIIQNVTTIYVLAEETRE